MAQKVNFIVIITPFLHFMQKRSKSKGNVLKKNRRKSLRGWNSLCMCPIYNGTHNAYANT